MITRREWLRQISLGAVGVGAASVATATIPLVQATPVIDWRRHRDARGNEYLYVQALRQWNLGEWVEFAKDRHGLAMRSIQHGAWGWVMVSGRYFHDIRTHGWIRVGRCEYPSQQFQGKWKHMPTSLSIS